MKCFVLAVCCGLMTTLSAADGWMTNFAAAKKLAKKENKPILVDFSGSDWCGWCIKLDKEVFSTKAFKEYAKKNLVLLMLDFPRGKKQAASLKKQNMQLARKYKVQGFPTVLLLNASGKVLATTGYQAGGPEKYIAHLKQLLKKK